MLNYTKLITFNPTEYGEMINSLGQKIVFIEHPIKGDVVEVICICHELKLAAYSTFFDTNDMEYSDYEPSFEYGKFYIGGSQVE
jgi:hypothetical protein